MSSYIKLIIAVVDDSLLTAFATDCENVTENEEQA
jgi:hypothetical protein